MTYLWVKAFHVIAVIAWYAGLFYIFRLFVYHVQQRDKPDVVATLAVMERRLLRAIMAPAAIVAVGLGAWMLVLAPGLLSQPWMHLKLGAVLLLLVYHALAIHTRTRFLAGDYFLSEKACRWINEWPTVLLFVIVIAVILRKPG
ncbi:MAG: CopD family protein [Gemmatimonadaceae bacterium]|jgi:putative membrane protein|nr:CopD family protein [Gemmatimonadaceae bacterium]